MSTLDWGDSPYDTKTPAEVVHDYAVTRGDLCEEYAREQLSGWIERYAAHRASEALDEAGSHLLKKAVVEADVRGGGRMTTRGAAIWDAAAWLREEAARDVLTATPASPAVETTSDEGSDEASGRGEGGGVLEC